MKQGRITDHLTNENLTENDLATRLAA
jgi:hypothetical protein